MRFCVIAIGLLALSACTPPPPVEQSRGVLWQQFGQHSVDDVMLAWGAPGKEAKLTTGARMLSYQRAVTYDAASPYERSSGCEANFLASPPAFKVDNIALKGDAYECYMLAKAGPGYTRNAYIPPPPPAVFYPGAYYR